MRAVAWITVAVLVGAGCGDDGPTSGKWTVVRENLPSALMSVWGTSASDVWAVGADVPEDTEGPLVMHFAGTTWETVSTGITGDLWWVFGFAGGPVYMGGQHGQIVRYEDGAFTTLTTPSASQTVFGIWGTSPDDMWAVGADEGGQSGGFAWRLQGDTWVNAADLPAIASTRAIWKVHGNAADDVWLVGTSGLTIHWNGSSFEEGVAGSTSLFTVHCDGTRCAAVGGFANGVIFENDGASWQNRATPMYALTGVYIDSRTGYSVGEFGTVLERADDGTWSDVDGVPTDETLHSVWVDPDGGIWTVGGRVRAAPLRNGVLAHRGAPLR